MKRLEILIFIIMVSACIFCIFKGPICWVLWFMGNLLLIVLYKQKKLYWLIAMIIIYQILNIWGFLEWVK